MTEEVVFSFCPRCDKGFIAKTKEKALSLVRDHILRNTDDLHENMLEEWDDMYE
jgi:hypothetical protein